MNKVAFVPARAGSKRFPNKNISELGGKPLVCWTLEAFLKSRCFDKIIFSSDSVEYLDIVQNYLNSDQVVFHQRTTKEASDKVKIFDYLVENAHKWVNQQDIFVLGLPTCPFRNEFHVKECFDLFYKYKKSVFTATEYDFSVPFAFSIVDQESLTWKPLLENSPLITGNTRSQDQVNYFHPNGGVYLLEAKEILNGRINTFYENAIPYIMDSFDSFDIDTERDLLMAKLYLRSREHKKY